MKKFVGYYRISSAIQNTEELDLFAQKNTVFDYARSRGELILGFTEIETQNRKKKRIAIYEAIELAKKENAVLVVAKLDRLARDVEFTSALLNGGADFYCCDFPGVNKVTIQIIYEIAKNETEAISKHTKEGLKAKKARIESKNYTNKDGSYMKTDKKGRYRLGNPNGFVDEHQQLGVQKIRENAINDPANRQAIEIICEKRNQGLSYQSIATYLNESGYKTRYGKAFNPIQIHRLYKRCEP
jgi:DNA invertase Pin-like site-specific DNA recombinase